MTPHDFARFRAILVVYGTAYVRAEILGDARKGTAYARLSVSPPEIRETRVQEAPYLTN